MQRKYAIVAAAMLAAASAVTAQTMGSKDKGPTVGQPTQTPLGAPPAKGGAPIGSTTTGPMSAPPTAGERGTAVGSGLAASGTTNGADDPYYTRAWNAMDANGDGRVSRDEYLKYYGTRYDEFDTTRRGYLGRDEMRRLYLEREMSKTDGHPRGTPLNPTTKK